MWLLSDKVTVRDSGLFERLCDYHSHLLPNVDDGVEKPEETLRILEQWGNLGVSDVWLTPHIMADIPNTADDLKQRFLTLTEMYHGTINLHLAAENMIDGLLLSRLTEGNLLPIGERHLLVETSYYNPPINMERVIDMIKEKGYTPILAHPERYQYMDADDYRKWKQKGVLFQLNYPSLVGAYGYESKKKAEWLLKKNLYDCGGTDTHSLESMEDFLESIINKKTMKRIQSSIPVPHY